MLTKKLSVDSNRNGSPRKLSIVEKAFVYTMESIRLKSAVEASNYIAATKIREYQGKLLFAHSIKIECVDMINL